MMVRTLTLCCVLSGCFISNPATGVGATGDPLRVKAESGVESYVSNDVVGQSTVRDRNGNEVGTVEHTAPRTHTYGWHKYSLHQGSQEIDEQDFFRLAGDKESVERIKSKRRSHRRMETFGLVLVGTSVVLTGGFIGMAVASDSLVGVGILGAVMMVAMGLPASGLVYLNARSKMSRKVIEEERAKEVADVVEMCWGSSGRCRNEPGGRRFRGSEPSSLSMRDEAPATAPTPPPVERRTSVVGAWRGEVTMEVSRAGVSKPDTTTATIMVTDVGGGSIEVDLDPENGKMCKLRGKERAGQASLEPSTCQAQDGGQKMEIKYASGSLMLRGGELVLDVLASITAKSRGKSERATVKWKGVLAPTR